LKQRVYSIKYFTTRDFQGIELEVGNMWR